MLCSYVNNGLEFEDYVLVTFMPTVIGEAKQDVFQGAYMDYYASSLPLCPKRNWKMFTIAPDSCWEKSTHAGLTPSPMSTRYATLVM